MFCQDFSLDFENTLCHLSFIEHLNNGGLTLKNRQERRNQDFEKQMRDQRRKEKIRRDKIKASKPKWGQTKTKRKNRNRSYDEELVMSEF